MSRLHIIFKSGSNICLQNMSCAISVVQGNLQTVTKREITNFANNRTVADLEENHVKNLREVIVNGETIENVSGVNYNGFRTNLVQGVLGFNRRISTSDTVEVTFDYIEPDDVNDTINLTTDATGVIDRGFDLESGAKELEPVFDDFGFYDLTVDNIDDNNIPSTTEQFEVVRDVLILDSSDRSIGIGVTLDGLDLTVSDINGYQTQSTRGLNEESYLLTGPTNIQNALESAKEPENSNPFVTVSAVIDVLDALGDAVDTKEDLRSVSINNVEDKELRLVKSQGDIYFYDSDSTQGDNNDTVLKPDELSNENQGRWITSNQQYSSHGNLNGLDEDDHTQYLNSSRHANEDHGDVQGVINSGSLGNRPSSSEEDQYYYTTDENTFTRDTGSGWDELIDFDNVPSSDQKSALSGSSGQPSSTNPYLTEDEKGTSEGVAELDNNAEVPLNQLKTAVSDGLATLNGNGNVESTQLAPNYKKHYVEDETLTSISSGFSSTSYTTVDVSTETDSKTQSIEIQVINQGSSQTQFKFRQAGATVDGPNRVNLDANGNPADSQIVKVPVNGSQEVEFAVDQNSVNVHLVGYHTTS